MDHQGLCMLSHLPKQDAEFYAHESNVVEMAGKSQAILEELYEQFVFVGGSWPLLGPN